MPAPNVALALVDYSAKRKRLGARAITVLARTKSNSTGHFELSGNVTAGSNVGVAEQNTLATPLLQATVGPTGLDDSSADVKIVVSAVQSMTTSAPLPPGKASTTAVANSLKTQTTATSQPTQTTGGGSTTIHAFLTTTTSLPRVTTVQGATTALAGVTTINQQPTTTATPLQTTTFVPVGTTTQTVVPTTTVTATTTLLRGELYFTTNGSSYTWTVPDRVDYISFVCVGQGGSNECQGAGSAGGGGALIYVNSLPVTPGTNYTIVNDAAGASVAGPGITSCVAGAGGSYANLTGGPGGVGSCTLVDGSITVVTHNGGDGGNTYYDAPDWIPGGSGGAAGYAGDGGVGMGGQGLSSIPTTGSGAGAGGASWLFSSNLCSVSVPSPLIAGDEGGGVGLFGIGATGSTYAEAGSGGSGGKFGGGGHVAANERGACRIIWPGQVRTFPSTDVGTS